MKSVVFADPRHTIDEVVRTMDELAEETYKNFESGKASKSVDSENPAQYNSLFHPQQESKVGQSVNLTGCREHVAALSRMDESSLSPECMQV